VAVFSDPILLKRLRQKLHIFSKMSSYSIQDYDIITQAAGFTVATVFVQFSTRSRFVSVVIMKKVPTVL